MNTPMLKTGFFPLLIAGTLSFCLPLAHSADSLSIDTPEHSLKQNKTYRKALHHLSENLPLQAIVLFEESLKNNELTKAQQDHIRTYLAEAQIRAGKPDAGLANLADLPDSELKTYWTAEAQFQKGHYTDALRNLEPLVRSDSDIPALQLIVRIAHQTGDRSLLINTLKQLCTRASAPESEIAALLLATVLSDWGDTAQADEVLKNLRNNDQAHPDARLTPYIELLEGRQAFAKGQTDQAIQIFTKLSTQKDYPTKIRDLATISLAHAEIRQEAAQTRADEPDTDVPKDGDDGHTGKAEDRLISFIGGKADSGRIMDAFLVLLSENIFDTDPQAREKLAGWVQSKDDYRQPAAMYIQGILMLQKQEWDDAISLAKEGLKLYPNKRPIQLLTQRVIMALPEQQQQAASELIQLLPKDNADTYFLLGIKAYREGNPQQASAYFRQARESGTEELAGIALFNENLTLLQSGSPEPATRLNRQTSTESERENLLFEQAHFSAIRMLPDAESLLLHYIDQATNRQQRQQAILDHLYVLLTKAGPTDLRRAQQIIQELSEDQLSSEQQAQLYRLKILLDENLQDRNTAIKICREALERYPERPIAEELTLKLGELLYKNGDFHEAQLVLQPFPTKYPDSVLVPTALFLAGKAAQQSHSVNAPETALNIFRELRTGNSPLADASGIEEASVLLRMGQAESCIALLETMKAKDIAPNLRKLALSIQADAWVASPYPDQEHIRKAISLCTEIIDSQPGLGWQYKAYTQRAQYYERLNEPEQALADYAAVMALTPTDDSVQQKDRYWFYNAGFASIRLMSQLQKWDMALSIADKLAKTNGPRAGEAAAAARRIQLEHFIWTIPDQTDKDNHKDTSESDTSGPES